MKSFVAILTLNNLNEMLFTKGSLGKEINLNDFIKNTKTNIHHHAIENGLTCYLLEIGHSSLSILLIQ